MEEAELQRREFGPVVEGRALLGEDEAPLLAGHGACCGGLERVQEPGAEAASGRDGQRQARHEAAAGRVEVLEAQRVRGSIQGGGGAQRPLQRQRYVSPRQPPRHPPLAPPLLGTSPQPRAEGRGAIGEGHA